MAQATDQLFWSSRAVANGFSVQEYECGAARMTALGRQIMKRVIVVVFSIIFLAGVVAMAPAQAASHSGPESLAKGDGQVSTSQTQNTPIYRTFCETLYIFGIPYLNCFPAEVARQVTVTETAQSFSFTAKLGPKTSTLDPTDGAFGKMNLTTTTSVTTSVVAGAYYAYCSRPQGDPNGFIQGTCPQLSPPSTSTQQDKATADVTCLNVVQNRATVGGHVVKFSGDNAPNRGLLFNATDNTVAQEQTAPDRFLGTFATDVPQTCPAPGADAPITSGDVYVKQD